VLQVEPESLPAAPLQVPSLVLRVWRASQENPAPIKKVEVVTCVAANWTGLMYHSAHQLVHINALYPGAGLLQACTLPLLYHSHHVINYCLFCHSNVGLASSYLMFSEETTDIYTAWSIASFQRQLVFSRDSHWPCHSVTVP